MAQPRAHAPGPPLPRGDRGGGQPHRLRRGGHGQAGEDGRAGEKLVAGAFFIQRWFPLIEWRRRGNRGSLEKINTD